MVAIMIYIYIYVMAGVPGLSGTQCSSIGRKRSPGPVPNFGPHAAAPKTLYSCSWLPKWVPFGAPDALKMTPPAQSKKLDSGLYIPHLRGVPPPEAAPFCLQMCVKKELLPKWPQFTKKCQNVVSGGSPNSLKILSHPSPLPSHGALGRQSRPSGRHRACLGASRRAS